ncbi:MAG: hypothetical protein HYV41_01135 [Candidatus Magasanikbacteria bacterium]|nr:hypothetical protein [Candidatus Magasanikbacteria bacterium]
MFIIDFDNTLFNTTTDPNNFREFRVRELSTLGVGEELYQETYAQARNEINTGRVMYSDERHAEILSRHGFDKEKVLDVLQKSMGDVLRNFLFSDAIIFLKKLKQFNQPLILFSLGDPEFQYLKVKGCGIEEYFDRVFMTPQPKREVLHELLSAVHRKEDIWFINDKAGETLEVCSLFPSIRAVLKVSANSTAEEYTHSGLPFFNTLTEIYNYISTYE